LKKDSIARGEKAYQHLIHNLPEVVFQHDQDGRFTFLSNRWKDFTQHLPVDTLNTSLVNYVHEQDKANIQNYLIQVLQDDAPFSKVEFRLLRKDGTFLWARLQACKEHEEGQNHNVYGTIQNIDENKQTEFALQEREQMLSFIVEHATEVFSIHDAKLNIIYVSPKVRQTLGYEPEEMIGKTTLDFVHPDYIERIKVEFEGLLMGKQYAYGRYQFLRKDGSAILLEALPQIVRDGMGRVTSVVVSHRDISQKLKIENELKAIRKKLSRDFHDELGNHITTISLLAKRLHKNLDKDNTDALKLVDKIVRSCKHLYEGTRDFIWAINPDHDRLDIVFLYLRDYAVELLEYSNIQLEIVADTEKMNLPLSADEAQQIVLIFKEAVHNLLKHAKASEAKLSLNILENQYNLQLADNGVGFNEDDPQGGQGISSMKARAHKINAELQIHSVRDKGTTVILQPKNTQL